MFGREKKTYDAPAVHKFSLDDSDVEKVTGGIKPQKTYKDEYDSGLDGSTGTNPGDVGGDTGGSGNPAAITGSSVVDNPQGNGDIGRGRGRGGGCDGVPYHRMARTFSSGRNSGC